MKGIRVYLAPAGALGDQENAFRGVQRYGNGLHFRVLVSYWYFRSYNLDSIYSKSFGEYRPDTFADSGAFSAWSQDGKVNVQEYAEWLHKWKHLFTVYSNLDVKGDVDAGLRNQVYLERQGLKPLPVFHGGEPFSVLEDLVQHYPYIALGGLSGHTTSGSREMWAFIIRCFKIARGRSVFHGFGMTNWKIMRALPWYSVDSSTWTQGFRFGAVPIFDGRVGKFHRIRLGDRRAWYKHAVLVRGMGYDPEDFADKTRYSRARTCEISAISYMQAEQWLRGKWGEISMPVRGRT